jgi:hypothetical protein
MLRLLWQKQGPRALAGRYRADSLPPRGAGGSFVD